MRVRMTEIYRDWIEPVVLLAGGDKSSQSRDIELAIRLAKNL